MDVSLVTDEVTLEPDVPGEILVDVVNTDEVIDAVLVDAVLVDLTGMPGTVARLEETPTLFPGERRRLPLQVRLPAQVPAGRHRMDVVVRAVATEIRHQAGLTVEVRPKPSLSVGVQPSVRLGLRSVTFGVTLANRGNTALHAELQEVDLPDGVSVVFRPDEARIDPWTTLSCTAKVTGPRHIVGAVREFPVDLRCVAWSSSPGHPFRDEELREDVRVTFRQRPSLGHGLVLSIALLLVLLIWGTLGFVGLRAFARSEGSPLLAADHFSALHPRVADVSVTISGKVVSVGDLPVAGANVLACSLDPGVRKACNPTEASASIDTDQDGTFVLSGLFPGPYRLKFLSPWGTQASLGKFMYTQSCSLNQMLPTGRGGVVVRVKQPAGEGQTSLVTVEAQMLPKGTASGGPDPSLPVCQDEPASKSPAPRSIAIFSAPTVKGKYGAGNSLVRLTGLTAPAQYLLTIQSGGKPKILCITVPAATWGNSRLSSILVETDAPDAVCSDAS
jgi:hypothetical protein